jgi:isoleucyl-tRNA synthetase
VNRIGADVFRLVFASVDYSSDMSVGENLFSAVSEAYRKLRNTCRYLLGNLCDFDPARDLVALSQMLEFDRFILARIERLKGQVWHAYEAFDFQAAYHAILNFVVVDLSSLYIDVVRDRLYCSAEASRERRSAQSALYLVLDVLVRMLAPLIPFTADEVYSHVPGAAVKSVHLLELRQPEPAWADAELEARWERLLQVRNEALKLLEAMRHEGTIGASLEARLRVGVAGLAKEGWGQMLGQYRDRLKELFIVSDVGLLDEAESAELQRKADGREDFKLDGLFGRVTSSPPVIVVGQRAAGRKCQRCWAYYDDEGDPELCPRCRLLVRV